jgi:hypothetical protein
MSTVEEWAEGTPFEVEVLGDEPHPFRTLSLTQKGHLVFVGNEPEAHAFLRGYHAKPSASMPSHKMTLVDLRLLAKLGSVAVHVDELWSYQPPASETADVLAARMLLRDPDITGWMAEMSAQGLLPMKRKRLDEEEDHIVSSPLSPAEREDLQVRRKVAGWALPMHGHAIELLPARNFRKGDKCPECPGKVLNPEGSAHMPGCIIGGWAE